MKSVTQVPNDDVRQTILKRVSPSVVVYVFLGLAIAMLRLSISSLPPGQIAPQMVNLTDTLSIFVIWLVGWVGVTLAPRTGFTGMWQADISHTRRFLLPGLVGVGLGLVTVIFDAFQPLGEGSLISFPTSVVAYPLAGILEEILFRLFLTTALVWILSNMLLRGRWQEAVFWGVAAFLGIFYTITQVDLYSSLVGGIDYLILARFFMVIAADFILAAYFYRRYGFLAALSLRLGDYLVWHIIWGALANR
jgi:hypothetical protein